MKFIVTGGRGFIGSHFVEEALKRGHSVVDIDKITYAASKTLPWDQHPHYQLVQKDINEISHLPTCDILINFAAESHVDNSIKSSEIFVNSNVLGVHNLLELLRGKQQHERPLFFQISTDEVYGDIEEGMFSETDILNPSNPYSATKAAAEMLVMSYGRTYGIEYIISRSSNNYGERQFEEKLIPKCISSILNQKPIPIHGDGSYIRDWTYVKDNIEGLFSIIDSGLKNQIFNVASGNYMTNLEVVKTVIGWHGKGEIKYVENRWGQDIRYAVSNKKIYSLTGWTPKYKKGLHNFIG